MAEYKMCANEDMAIYILDFIKRGYENKYQDAGVQKYIDALQMGIDAIGTVNHLKTEIERLQNCNKICTEAIGDQEIELATAKSEAYKEIIEKLKAHLCSYDLPDYHSFRAVDEDTIDEVLEELVGGNNG